MPGSSHCRRPVSAVQELSELVAQRFVDVADPLPGDVLTGAVVRMLDRIPSRPGAFLAVGPPCLLATSAIVSRNASVGRDESFSRLTLRHFEVHVSRNSYHSRLLEQIPGGDSRVTRMPTESRSTGRANAVTRSRCSPTRRMHWSSASDDDVAFEAQVGQEAVSLSGYRGP